MDRLSCLGLGFGFGLRLGFGFGLEPYPYPSPTVAASLTYGCSISHLRWQPLSPMVAASLTYGCSLSHLRLQAGRLFDEPRDTTVIAPELTVEAYPYP